MERVDDDTIKTLIPSIGQQTDGDAFYIADIGDIVLKYRIFQEELYRWSALTTP